MKKITPDVLERYMTGKCTPEERAMVDLWFKQFENDLEDPRLEDPQQRSDLDSKMLVAIKNKISENALAVSKEKTFTIKPLRRSLYRIVSGVAAALMLGLLTYYLTLPEDAPANLVKVKTEFLNTSDGIERHELADGTMIWLRPNSRIEFPAEFPADRRELKLVGEAFFDVARDENRPFIITTGNVTTKVLGTSFNIKAYNEASSIEVSVLTGKVSVNIVQPETTSQYSSSVLLTPNQRVTYSKVKNTLEKEEADALPELSIWQATDVVFDNVPVRDVVAILNKKFGVRIQTSNKNLLNCLIRADFTNQNLPDILELLSKSVEATYELKNDTIYLSGVGCAI